MPHRTAVVEASWPFGLLFLNNNLHALHHARPTIPWYDLPDVYAREQADITERNGGLVYKGYREVARAFPVPLARRSGASRPQPVVSAYASSG